MGGPAKSHDKIIDAIQNFLGNRLFFFFLVCGSLGWMTFELFQRDPIDPPKAFYPGTILILTLLTAYDAAATKVSQREQLKMQLETQEKDRERDERVEGLVKAIHSQGKVTFELVRTVVHGFNKIADVLEGGGGLYGQRYRNGKSSSPGASSESSE